MFPSWSASHLYSGITNNRDSLSPLVGASIKDVHFKFRISGPLPYSLSLKNHLFGFLLLGDPRSLSKCGRHISEPPCVASRLRGRREATSAQRNTIQSSYTLLSTYAIATTGRRTGSGRAGRTRSNQIEEASEEHLCLLPPPPTLPRTARAASRPARRRVATRL